MYRILPSMIWLGLSFPGNLLFAQDIYQLDTVMLFSIRQIAPEPDLEQWKISREFDYSVTFSDLLQLNRQHTTKSNQLEVSQNLRLQSTLVRKERVKFSNSVLHTLGVQFYFDSITRFQVDENILDTKLDLTIYRNFSGMFNSVLTTRIFNDYNYGLNDSGLMVRYLNSGFLTPLVWTFSLGFCWNWKEVIRLNFGLSTARLTYVRDKRVYSSPGTELFHGVPRNKPAALEYGFSFRLLIDKSFREKVFWKCEVGLFKNYNAPLDLSVRNDLDIRITKFLKTSIQTRIYYEESQSCHLQLENLISFGFNFHL